MSAVNFYVLNDVQASHELFACRLCQRALQEGLPLFVWCESAEALERFDQLLWNFQASSFIPHDVDDARAPICLGVNIPDDFLKATPQKVGCLNLSGHAVTSAEILDHFDRVIEIIEANEVAKAAGRERFKAYKKHGITPITHQIK